MAYDRRDLKARTRGGVPPVMPPDVQKRYDQMQKFKPQIRSQVPGGKPGFGGGGISTGPGGRPIGPPMPPVSAGGGGYTEPGTVPGISVEMPRPGRGGPMPPQQGGGLDTGQWTRPPQPPGVTGFGDGPQNPNMGFDPGVAFNRPLGMGMGGFGGVPPWMRGAPMPWQQGGGFGGPGFGGPPDMAGGPGFGGAPPWMQGGGFGGGFEPQPWGGGFDGGLGFGGGMGYQRQPFQV